MSTIGGPKKPGDPPKVGGKVLSFPVPPKTGATPEPAVQTPPAPTEGGFDPNAAKGTALPEPVAPEQRGGNLKARLAAMGQLPIKTAAKDAGRVKETPLGKIFDGSVTIESAAGLKKLEGVVRVSGDLVVAESVAKSADFLTLRSLHEVGGRLTIEGNASVAVLDALENLERARGIYVGFNAALTKLSLPRLKELEAALIVEHNPNLTEISLPAFAKGGRYLHVHENAALTSLSLPSLAALEDELSLLDNPRLTSVKVGSREKPAKVPLVEVRGNGAPSFAQLHARA